MTTATTTATKQQTLTPARTAEGWLIITSVFVNRSKQMADALMNDCFDRGSYVTCRLEGTNICEEGDCYNSEHHAAFRRLEDRIREAGFWGTAEVIKEGYKKEVGEYKAPRSIMTIESPEEVAARMARVAEEKAKYDEMVAGGYDPRYDD